MPREISMLSHDALAGLHPGTVNVGRPLSATLIFLAIFTRWLPMEKPDRRCSCDATIGATNIAKWRRLTLQRLGNGVSQQCGRSSSLRFGHKGNLSMRVVHSRSGQVAR